MSAYLYDLALRGLAAIPWSLLVGLLIGIVICASLDKRRGKR